MKKVDERAARSEELTGLMNSPEVAANGALLVKYAREHGELERVVKPYRKYREVAGQLAELRQIIDDPAAEAELREIAEAELPEVEARRAGLIEQLQELLVTGDDAAIRSIILEIRAGTGGEEAALFARELMNMYVTYAQRHGFKVEMMSLSDSDMGGIREAVLNIVGPEAFLHYRFESGGHRVQRVPKTEAQGRIHTSAATVAVLPEPEEINIDINWEKDVIEHVSRAGGPGGQNVNKVASAIKLEHPATGITVSMRDDKSQHKNRAKARRLMLSRLFDHYQSQQSAKIASERKSMVGSGDRSERIRTYNFPQNRCTDHRINKDAFGLDRILIEGRFDDFREALHERELKMRLEAL
jgi:peptide chain release factor 1